ncbi:MAG: hypothetical protein NC116_12115 [Clostridium sp.]|nr:hypothetical protein [Clostridium sp.]
MNKYITAIGNNPNEWQLWAAANLRRMGVGIVRIDYVQTPLALSWQHKLEEKKCSVTINDDLVEQIVLTEDRTSDMSVVINLCGIPSSILRSQLGDSIKIWDVCYHNSHISLLSSMGEYEQQNDAPTIPVQLIENGDKVIDVAEYPIHFSAVRNYSRVAYSIYLLIIKAIKTKQDSANEYKTDSQINYSIAKYLVSFYQKIVLKNIHAISNKLFGVYYEQWTVGVSYGSFLKDGLSNLKVIPMPRNEFWADPFLYHHKVSGKNFLFIERFPFKEKKGVLSCAEVDRDLNVIGMHDILERPYHFSYPHLIEEDDQLYMMPECSANRRLEVYKCVEFPDKWELYSSGMEGKSLADTVYYRDKNGDAWIFTAQNDTNVDLHCTIMNIYKVDSLQLKEVTPHRLNPIIINCGHSRNGGRIYEEDGRIYRVAQDNTHGRYGYGISVREITKLSLDEYEEKEVRYQRGKDIPGFIGTHQMCQIDGMFVMDLRKK